MTKDEIRQTVLRILGDIAPEADLSRINPEVSFREQLDIDSMDFLNFVIALDEELHVEIPEADYPKFITLNGGIEHLATLLNSQRQAS
jgi:acyl carrier protein